jgi:hypothetical protein
MLSKNISRYVLLFISIWFFWELANHFPNNVLSWDVYGAYLHLPANFIYKDPFLTDWSWIERLNEQYNSTPSYYQFWYADTGNQVIKYPIGFALIYAPFFFVGHWLAPFLGYAQDGFSAPYQWSIIAGHCFYVLLGLWMARKVLLHFFTDKIAALLLLILFAGTNFYFTTTTMVAMPHGHLFLFYALILWFTIRWHKQPSIKNSVLLGLSIGLASLIRATEILTVLIPLFWQVTNKESLLQKWQFIKAHKKQILAIAIVVFLLGALQLVYYKLATGHFFIDAYNNAGEGFDFFSPHTVGFLFSARKGWLVYTPVFLLSCWGFWIMWRYKNSAFLALFIFILLNVYVLSSWTCWWYAESFGQRALVQSYLVLLIPLGFFLEHVIKQKLGFKIFAFSVVMVCIGLNQFQTWQLHKGLIHPSRMTKDAYWANFMRTQAVVNFEDLLLVNKDVPAEYRLENEMDKLTVAKQFRFSFQLDSWVPVEWDSEHEPEGVWVNDNQIYSKDLVLKYPELTSKKNVIFKLEASVFCTGNVKDVLPRIVFKMRHRGKPYYDQYLHLDEHEKFQTNTWIKVEHIFYSADVRNMKRDEIQIFAWLAGQGAFKVDNFKLTVYEGLR